MALLYYRIRAIYVKVKTSTNTSDDVYNKWYEKVYEPQSEASSVVTEESDPQG